MILGLCFSTSWERWIIGLAIGLLWGNAFEYGYHRWLLHWPQSSFGKGHLLHHGTLGSPEEPEHVTFGNSRLRVTALFWSNGIPLLVLDRWLGLGVSPGIMTAWSFYLIAVEEIHWRIHLGGWLPPGLNAARGYHLAHHDIADGRFNVFFPLLSVREYPTANEGDRSPARRPTLIQSGRCSLVGRSSGNHPVSLAAGSGPRLSVLYFRTAALRGEPDKRLKFSPV
jgi:hypothetical protein